VKQEKLKKPGNLPLCRSGMAVFTTEYYVVVGLYIVVAECTWLVGHCFAWHYESSPRGSTIWIVLVENWPKLLLSLVMRPDF
jgi:hypothetical protein